MRVRRGFLARVRDEAGRVGLGEAAPLPPWTEDLKTCAAALEAAGEHLDAPVEDPAGALSDLDAFCKPIPKAPAARHALASALLDLAAQRAGQPLCTWLGQACLGRRVAPGTVAVNAVLGAGAPGDVAAEAAERRKEGFGCLKLKLAGTPAEDEAVVRAAREAAGDAELRVDPNAAWTAVEAVARLARLRPFGLAYVEQPVAAADLAGLREVRTAGLVPVAADEAAATVAGARRVLDAGAADLLVVKPHALGGPDRACEVLAVAAERGVPCVVTSLLDGPVGLLAARHVAALLPEPRPACGLAAEGLFERDLPGLAAVRGRVAVPAGPGLGLGAPG